ELDPGLVEVRVAPRLRDRVLVEVHGRHVLRTARDLRVERKARRVTTQVQHTRAPREASECTTVVTLVTEEAGLVTRCEVDFVADAVLPNLHGPRRGCIRVLERRRLDAFETAEIVIHVYAGETRSRQFM